MPIKFISDQSGNTTDVIIPIETWNHMKNKFPEMEEVTNDTMPDWQKQIIDQRREAIRKNPERLFPIDQLFDELDND